MTDTFGEFVTAPRILNSPLLVSWQLSCTLHFNIHLTCLYFYNSTQATF